MANNSYTDNMNDGTTLTDAQLDTALTSLKLDLSNTDQMTQTAAAGTFLKASTPGSPATWALPDDPTASFVRNYGISASASAGALTINLKTASGADPSASSKVDVAFSTSGTSSAVFQKIQVATATSLTITSSATLGTASTATHKIYVYAINVSTTTVKLAVSSNPFHDDGKEVTTVAMAASSDNGRDLYGSASIGVKARFLGCVEAARNSSFAWQSPSRISIGNPPLQALTEPVQTDHARASKSTTVVGTANLLTLTLTPTAITGAKNFMVSVYGQYLYVNSNGTTMQTRPTIRVKDTTSGNIIAETGSPSTHVVATGYNGIIGCSFNVFVPVPTGTTYTVELYEVNVGGGTYTATNGQLTATCSKVLV